MTGAAELLHELARHGIAVAAAGDKLLIRPPGRMTANQRAALVAAKPELLAILTAGTERPYRLTKDEGDAAHAEPWDDDAIARFLARVAGFMDAGFSEQDAEDAAERAHLGDVQSSLRESVQRS